MRKASREKRTPEQRAATRERYVSWLSANREHKRQYDATYHKANAERKSLANSAWRLANSEAFKKVNREWREANPHYVKALKKAWCLANPDKVASYRAVRKAKLIQRTPRWLREKDYEMMAAFYLLARMLSDETGEPHHVDHIIPLQGEKVSGLHVPGNLQVLTAFENIKKHNTWSVE
jgi:hypothetical protein